jgi:hypothetical protein
MGMLFVIYSLWLLHIVCEMGWRLWRGTSVAWDLVDVLVLGCSLWMFVAYTYFNDAAEAIRSSWSLSAETTAFMASRYDGLLSRPCWCIRTRGLGWGVCSVCR